MGRTGKEKRDGSLVETVDLFVCQHRPGCEPLRRSRSLTTGGRERAWSPERRGIVDRDLVFRSLGHRIEPARVAARAAAGPANRECAGVAFLGVLGCGNLCGAADRLHRGVDCRLARIRSRWNSGRLDDRLLSRDGHFGIKFGVLFAPAAARADAGRTAGKRRTGLAILASVVEVCG